MDAAKSYSLVSQEYIDRIYDELDKKPFDQERLKRLAEEIPKDGLVCDLGCGPGQVAKFLADMGVRSCGIDIAPGMIEAASELNPDIEFQVGDIRKLVLPDNTFDGIAAFYSLIHIPKEDLPEVFQEIRRVLKPGGKFLFSFHIGEETIHKDEWWGYDVDLDFHFFDPELVEITALEAGFEEIIIEEREPYCEDIEHQSRRAYFYLRNPVL